MLDNYFSAAVRALTRYKSIAVVNILGLATGMATTILISLYVHDEINYDQFLPGYTHIYRLASELNVPGQASLTRDTVSPDVARLIRQRFTSVAAVARLIPKQLTLRHGEVESDEQVYWADPDILGILAFPAFSGEMRHALDAPQSVVITESVARKYFGAADAVGGLLEVNRKNALRVTAVIKDLPADTHLDTTIIASGKSPFSEIARLDAVAPGPSKPWTAFTYLQLQPGADPATITSGLDEFFARLVARGGAGVRLHLPLVRLDRIHLHSIGQGGLKMRPGGSITLIYALAAIGALVLLAASVNFINLMSAQATRRACEVGVRKAAGASRAQLITQFLGEMLVFAGLAAAIGLVMVRMLSDRFETFIGRPIAWVFWSDGTFSAAVLGLTVLIGLLAGIYPALLLSGFRPGEVLGGTASPNRGSDQIRRILVIAQFAITIGLIVATLTIYRQSRFAMNEGMRLDKDQVLIINGPCADAFVAAVRALPGVRSVACSMQAPFGNGVSMLTHTKGGTSLELFQSAVDFDFFRVYGLDPLAGRFFSRAHSGDEVNPQSTTASATPLVINEAAASRLGFAPASTAVGQSIPWRRLVSLDGQFAPEQFAPIVGVVSDFPMGTIEKSIEPTVFFVDNTFSQQISVKLVGRNIPETLGAIDRLWPAAGQQRPIDRFFLSDYVEKLYLTMLRTSSVLTAFAIVALSVAALGLIGLAAFSAETRAREIAIRKVAGASTRQILTLLLWQFSTPVVVGSLVAWPTVYWAMTRWLEQFAYRVDLPLWLIGGVTAITLALAWLTVSPQAWRMARTRPIAALRHE